MKKLILLLAVFLLASGPVQAATLADTLSGKILLQVQAHGEAWYVYPVDKKRYYMKDGATAYQMLRSFGLGISNANLAKIPVGFEPRFVETDSDSDGLSDQLEDALGTNKNNPDSDGDGFKDGNEVRQGYSPLGPQKLAYDTKLVNTLKGKILLQIEGHGEAWYVKPDDGKRYYMRNGDAAYQIMRFLSLGITDANLNKISIGTLTPSVAGKGTNCGTADQAELSYTYADDGTITSVDTSNTTKQAWQCFTTQLKNCTVAYLRSSDPSLPPYQIQGLQGNNCIVTGPVIHPETGNLVESRSCAIPTQYITFVYNQTHQELPNASFYQGYATTNIVRNGGGQIQYADGTNITISCQ